MYFIVKHGLLLHQARETDLKRKFEDGVIGPEMSQFLRLHAREDDFATTVLKARQFVDASELIKPKKIGTNYFAIAITRCTSALYTGPRDRPKPG